MDSEPDSADAVALARSQAMDALRHLEPDRFGTSFAVVVPASGAALVVVHRVRPPDWTMTWGDGLDNIRFPFVLPAVRSARAGFVAVALVERPGDGTEVVHLEHAEADLTREWRRHGDQPWTSTPTARLVW